MAIELVEGTTEPTWPDIVRWLLRGALYVVGGGAALILITILLIGVVTATASLVRRGQADDDT